MIISEIDGCQFRDSSDRAALIIINNDYRFILRHIQMFGYIYEGIGVCVYDMKAYVLGFC